LPEGLAEPSSAVSGFLVPALPEVKGHLSREAGGEAQHSFGVGGKYFLIDARPAIKPFGKADRGESHQVLVAGPVAGQEHQVAVGCRRPGRLLARGSGPKCQVCFKAENGPDFLLLGLLVELPRRVHVAVVRDRQAVHAKLLHMGNQLGDLIGPIEE
jgi:hypothetical protein